MSVAPHTRRTHSPTLKARVVLGALCDDKATADLCKKFELHASQVIEWRRQLLEGAAGVFGSGNHAAPPLGLAQLHANIGQFALENDFLERGLKGA